MKYKKILFSILIIILTIGFSSVTTTLVLNGKNSVAFDKNNLQVIFTRVRLNNEESENIIISEDGKSFVYIADDLTLDNNTSTIEYNIKNMSSQYDATVVVSCITDYPDNIEYTGNTLNQVIEIPADDGYTDTLTTTLKQENTSSNSLALKCSLIVNPIERDTIMLGKEYNITFDSNGGSTIDAPTIVNYYEKYGELPIPTKANNEFLGWYTEAGEKIDSSSLVKIKDNHTLIAKWNQLCPYDIGKTWFFDYISEGEDRSQEFSVPCSGEYKLETWGASGGYAYDESRSTGDGGYGAYAVGKISLNRSKSIFVNIGGEGESNCQTTKCRGGYNGGSPSNKWANGSGTGLWTGGGGGATHIASKNGLLSNFDNDKEKVYIVSAGGGGGDYYPSWKFTSSGGSGGGITGNSGITYLGELLTDNVGTQNSGYAFGTAGTTLSIDSTGGSGGGWYGGISNSIHSTGSGGSSYIGNTLLSNKAMYCYNCTESNEESTKTVSTTCSSSTPTVNCAKQGNGYARITLVSLK